LQIPTLLPRDDQHHSFGNALAAFVCTAVASLRFGGYRLCSRGDVNPTETPTPANADLTWHPFAQPML
jgi:hypothetical protein